MTRITEAATQSVPQRTPAERQMRVFVTSHVATGAKDQ